MDFRVPVVTYGRRKSPKLIKPVDTEPALPVIASVVSLASPLPTVVAEVRKV